MIILISGNSQMGKTLLAQNEEEIIKVYDYIDIQKKKIESRLEEGDDIR